MADVFIHELMVDIQGTEVRAGFLKCATDKPGVTQNVAMVLRAVARAHLQTGAPIMTHSHPRSENGLQQQDIFEEEGVDLSQVLIGHCGDSDDIAYLEKIAERGSYLGMDRYGLEEMLPSVRRNETVARMCLLGYSGQMMVSQDSVSVRDSSDTEEQKSLRAKWTLSYVVDEVIPQLKQLGVSQEALDNMTINNVRRWFESVR